MMVRDSSSESNGDEHVALSMADDPAPAKISSIRKAKKDALDFLIFVKVVVLSKLCSNNHCRVFSA